MVGLSEETPPGAQPGVSPLAQFLIKPRGWLERTAWLIGALALASAVTALRMTTSSRSFEVAAL